MSRETPASSNEKPPLVEQPIKLIPRTGSGNINLTARSSRGMPSAVSSGQASSSKKTYPSSIDRRSMAIATKRSFFDVEVKPTLAELASPQVSGGIRNDSTTRINTLPKSLTNYIDYSTPNIKFSNYSSKKPLGMGASGAVYLIEQSEHPLLPRQMALKKNLLPIDNRHKHEELRRLQGQMKTLMKDDMQHPNLLKHFGWDVCLENQTDIFLIFSEYCGGGTLKSLAQARRITLMDLKNYSSQVLLGLDFLHRHKVVHRDIKGDNIFVSKDHILKIGDYSSSNPLAGTHTKTNELSGMTGTVSFMAPEVIQETSDIGRKSDIWSFACLMIEIVNHGVLAGFNNTNSKLRYPSTQVQFLSIFGGRVARPRYKLAKSVPWLSALLDWCLQETAEDRPTALQLLTHPFFTDAKFESQGFLSNFVTNPGRHRTGFADPQITRQFVDFVELTNSIKIKSEEDYRLWRPAFSTRVNCSKPNPKKCHVFCNPEHEGEESQAVCTMIRRLLEPAVTESMIIDAFRKFSKPEMKHENLLRHFGWNLDAYISKDGACLQRCLHIYTEEFLTSPFRQKFHNFPFQIRINTLSRFCRHILSALQHLHSLGICHREVNFGNIFVERVTFKLGVFKFTNPEAATFGEDLFDLGRLVASLATGCDPDKLDSNSLDAMFAVGYNNKPKYNWVRWIPDLLDLLTDLNGLQNLDHTSAHQYLNHSFVTNQFKIDVIEDDGLTEISEYEREVHTLHPMKLRTEVMVKNLLVPKFKALCELKRMKNHPNLFYLIGFRACEDDAPHPDDFELTLFWELPNEMQFFGSGSQFFNLTDGLGFFEDRVDEIHGYEGDMRIESRGKLCVPRKVFKLYALQILQGLAFLAENLNSPLIWTIDVPYPCYVMKSSQCPSNDIIKLKPMQHIEACYGICRSRIDEVYELNCRPNASNPYFWKLNIAVRLLQMRFHTKIGEAPKQSEPLFDSKLGTTYHYEKLRELYDQLLGDKDEISEIILKTDPKSSLYETPQDMLADKFFEIND